MNEKVLIFGSTGMAGHIASRFLRSLDKYKVVDVSRSRLDGNTILLDILEQPNSIKKFLEQANPDVVINAVGTLIKDSETHPDHAIYTNAYFPRYLEQLGQEMHFKLIQLSTDCVFSGEQGNYAEGDVKDGQDVYAKTKSLGEVINNRDLTFRTSIIGPELKYNGTSLFHWFMTQTGPVFGYTNVFWTGITTLELAKALDCAIDQNLTGLYHLVPNRKISKYDLLQLIKEIWHHPSEILEDSRPVQDKSLINHRTDFDYHIPDYLDMLSELKAWMEDWDYAQYVK